MITKTYTERKKKYKQVEDACLRCGLFEHTTNPKINKTKLQQGNAGKVLIITGSPSVYAEARKSIHYDKTASVIKKYMKEYLTDCEVWLTCSVKCYPKDWKVKTHEVRHCSGFLDADISDVNPDIVIAMGDIARMGCKELEQEYESSIHPQQLAEGSLDRTIRESFSRTGKEIRKELEAIPLGNSIYDIVREAIREGFIGIDFEWNIDTDETHTVGFSSSNKCIALPLDNQVKTVIKLLCNRPNLTIVGHNIVADVIRILKFTNATDIHCRFMDTLVLKRQLAPQLPTGGLKFFAHNYLYIEDYAKDITMDDYAQYSQKLADYCAGDAYVGVALYNWFKNKYNNKWKDMEPARDIDMDMILPVAEMIKGGIAIDKKKLKEMTKDLHKNVQDVLYKINEEWSINPGSPSQVLDTLHSLGFNVEGTGESVLKTINHDFAKDVLKFRKYSKLYNTYATKIPEWATSKGRLHCNLHLASTVTGRMTSSKPNMQNIPPLVRPCFQSIFGPDGILMTVDASQSELRCLAYLSGSKHLIDSYNQGIDMHTMVSKLANINRRDAKTLNFAYVYGASEFRLRQELTNLGLSKYQATITTRNFMKTMQKLGIDKYQKRLLTDAETKGYNTSVYGRIGERLNPTQVVNFPVQSFSADLNKIRIIQMYQALKEKNLMSRIWLEFHDAMELDIYKPELDTIIELVNQLDTSIPDILNKNIQLDLPLDMKYDNKNWN